MGKDAKSKDAGGKGKGKQSGIDDGAASKGKGKGGKSSSDGLGTCTYVKDILCEKQGKVNEAYKKLQDGWLDSRDEVPPAEFAKVAAEYSECPWERKRETSDGSHVGKWLAHSRKLLSTHLSELPVRPSNQRTDTT